MDENFVQHVTFKDIRSKCKRDNNVLNSKKPNPVIEFMKDYRAEIPDVLFDGFKDNYYSKCYILWHCLGIVGYGAVLFVLLPFIFYRCCLIY